MVISRRAAILRKNGCDLTAATPWLFPFFQRILCSIETGLLCLRASGRPSLSDFTPFGAKIETLSLCKVRIMRIAGNLRVPHVGKFETGNW